MPELERDVEVLEPVDGAVVVKSNYLGSKRRLAKYIVGKFPGEAGTLHDPMCGVSAVLIEAARRGWRVRGNDLSVVPYWYSKGIFEGAELSDGDVRRLVEAPAHDGWLTSEWEGVYPRPKAVRRYLDGLAKVARDMGGGRGWAAKAVASLVLQTTYSESGSGYSTRRYESVDTVRKVVERAAKEVNRLAGEVSGKGLVTNEDALNMRIPRADVVYFDPPYFKRDKGAVHYFQTYRVMNSILLGREWKEANLKPEDIPAIVERLCKAAGRVFISTSSKEVVPYARELARHKRTMKRYRVSYRQTSGFGSRDELQHQHLYVAKAADGDPYLTTPAEDGTYRYVVQEHFRGRSVHADLRIETGGGSLIGWTLNTQIAGRPEQPVETLDEARENVGSGHSRIDWETGEVTDGVVTEPKAPSDTSWLEFEGVIEPGSPGATAGLPGVIVIVDGGVCEYGAQRLGVHEYFLTPSGDGGFRGRVLFTRVESSTEGRGAIWLLAKPEDPTPYVLSDRAVEDGWVPPPGLSALPKQVRDEIPEEYRYWEKPGEAERRDRRDALVRALGEGRARLAGAGKRMAADEDDFEKRKLVPFNQWGSSAKYAKRLAAKLPEHKRYVEPFCGAAALLFAKERADEEVLADTDPEVVFALNYIKKLTPERFEKLKRLNWTVSRTGFKRARETAPSSDEERFWKLVYGRLCSWGGISGTSGFSTIHDGQSYDLGDLWRFNERLKGAKVVKRDWRETLSECDGKGVLFFIDPPYVEEWAGGKGGKGIPPEEIAEAVSKLKGMYVIAYTDSARARRALSKAGRLFRLKILEARNRGLWAKRSRLFAASFEIGGRGK